MNVRKQFTIIELLVVIAIIAILAAMLLPALNKARESSRHITCLSNVKQLGLGIVSYSFDFGEYIPSINVSALNTQTDTSSWCTWLFLLSQGYCNPSAALKCPSDPMVRNQKIQGKTYWLSYGLSEELGRDGSTARVPLHRVKRQKSTVVVFAEASVPVISGANSGYRGRVANASGPANDYAPGSGMIRPDMKRHGKGSITFFADAHADTAEQVKIMNKTNYYYWPDSTIGY